MSKDKKVVEFTTKQKKEEPVVPVTTVISPTIEEVITFLKVLDIIRYQSPSQTGFVYFNPEQLTISLEDPIKETTFGNEEFATAYLSYNREAIIWFTEEYQTGALNIMEALQKMEFKDE